MQLIADDELERLSQDRGPDSLEAKALSDLGRERARDKHVFAFRLGEFYVIGPIPDAQTQLTLMLANECAKHMRGSKPL